MILSCKENHSQWDSQTNKSDHSINTKEFTRDTVDFTSPSLSYVNGIYFFNTMPFSGIVYKELKGFKIKTYSSVFNGKLNGDYKSYYPSGDVCESRKYKDNFKIGKQCGYWNKTGKRKFEYNYYNQKKEGLQRNWYVDGSPYYEYNYKDDHLDGLQRAWRKNGSLFRNFVVKNGIRYGLQKSAQCYEISNDSIKLTSNTGH